MKLLAIAGSLRENSYNRQLAEAAGALMREKHPEVGYGILRWEDVPFMNQDIGSAWPRSWGSYLPLRGPDWNMTT